jgi:hypothetical protein
MVNDSNHQKHGEMHPFAKIPLGEDFPFSFDQQ